MFSSFYYTYYVLFLLHIFLDVLGFFWHYCKWNWILFSVEVFFASIQKRNQFGRPQVFIKRSLRIFLQDSYDGMTWFPWQNLCLLLNIISHHPTLSVCFLSTKLLIAPRNSMIFLTWISLISQVYFIYYPTLETLPDFSLPALPL